MRPYICFSPRHLGAARSCSRVIANPAQKWLCQKNALFLTWVFWGVGFNSATDNTPPFFLLLFQTPHAPSLKPSRLCYRALPPLYYIPPFMRFCLKVHFSDKKPKKARFSGFEPPTTDTTDARDATKLPCSVVLREVTLDFYVLPRWCQADVAHLDHWLLWRCDPVQFVLSTTF